MTPGEIAADERRRAIRMLLASPILRAGRDDEALVLVRRHAAALANFFRDELGWSLYVGTDVVRLAKSPGRVDDATRGLVDRHGQPFSRRRYVLLSLAMAALCRADRQTTLHQVAEEVMLLARGDEALEDAGFSFALEVQADRRDLVAIVGWLLEHGVLVRVDGDEDGFVQKRNDVLYDVDSEVLARVPIWRVPPTLTRHPAGAARLWELLGEPSDDEAGDALRRHRLARRVVDDPVVYYQDLDEPNARYLTAVRGTVLRRLAEATGLELESRREGVALADAAGELSDRFLPEEGTEGHITLLLAEYLASRIAGATVPRDDLVDHLASCREAHGKFWRADAREEGHEGAYVALALERLVALDLARAYPDGSIRPMPAIARCSLIAPDARREDGDANG